MKNGLTTIMNVNVHVLLDNDLPCVDWKHLAVTDVVVVQAAVGK